MSVEKMKILEMLEKGKINAQDAAKLLSAAETGADAKTPYAGGQGGNGGAASYAGRGAADKTPYAGGQSRNEGAASHARRGGIAEDWGRKFDGFMRDMEPKLRVFSEKVVEQTAKVADSISKSLSSASTAAPVSRPSGGQSGHAAPAVSSSVLGANERSYEIKVSGRDNVLNLSSVNGSVLLKGYNGDRITAKLYSKPKKAGASIELMTMGNKFYLNYDEDLFERVSVDAYIPYNMFSGISLSGVNSPVTASGISCGEFIASSSNFELSLRDIKAGVIKADAQNTRELRLQACGASEAELESSGGRAYFSDNDIENLKFMGFNTAVDFNVSRLADYASYLWLIESSNQRVNAVLPNDHATGYYIKAQSSLGSVKIGLTNINYIFNDGSNAEAKSLNYDHAERKVRFSLETSNAPLVIN